MERRAARTFLAIATAIVFALAVAALLARPGEEVAAPSVTPTADETEFPAPSPSPSPSPTSQPSPTAPLSSPTPTVSDAVAETGPPFAAGWIGIAPLLGAILIALALRRPS